MSEHPALRSPAVDRNAFDLASFYIEELKYGPGEGKVERVSDDQLVCQLEALLREAGVTSMSGQQLCDALEFYGLSLARSFRAHPTLTSSCFLDGVVHGIAFAGGLEGEPRDPKDAS